MRYRTIVADPPWEYDATPMRVPTGRSWTPDETGQIASRELPYPSMTLKEIAEVRVGILKVRHIADEDARLFIWTTNRYLPDTFPIITAWGFKYAQTLVWAKTNPTPFGGSVAPIGAEYLVVATRGSPGVLSRWPESVIHCGHLAHSQKPDVFLDLVEAVSPGPYLEMFSRRARLGWDTWGNEALNHIEMGA